VSEEMKETMTPDAGVQDGGNVNDSGQATAGQDAPKSDVKTITQEELDRIIQQRSSVSGKSGSSRSKRSAARRP